MDVIMTTDDGHSIWMDSDPLPEAKKTEANQKVFELQRKHKFETLGDRPLVMPDEAEARTRTVAPHLRCPVVAYTVEGCGPDEWAGLLFYEVQDSQPRPDTDLLLGFPGPKGTHFIVTRRGTNRIRSTINVN